MRTRKDIDNSARHNETKVRILNLLAKQSLIGKYLYASDIARMLGITVGNTLRQLSKLHRQRYIYRRKQRDKSHRGEYQYCFLREQGRRVSKELWIRVHLREIDPRVSLNLKKFVPPDLFKKYQELEMEYTHWLLQPDKLKDYRT